MTNSHKFLTRIKMSLYGIVQGQKLHTLYDHLKQLPSGFSHQFFGHGRPLWIGSTVWHLVTVTAPYLYRWRTRGKFPIPPTRLACDNTCVYMYTCTLSQ